MNTHTNNPYIGPRTFLKEERHLFFGRDREASDLSALVMTEKLVLFYAQSGAGKSSLINTSLIPELEKNLYEVLPVARVSGDLPGGFEPGNVFIYNLMRSLIKREVDPQLLFNLSFSEFLGKLNEDENGYYYDEGLKEAIRGNANITPWRRALVIDQFEEIFSTHLDAWEKREDFFRQLAQAMKADPYLWIVLVLRDDYIASLDPYAYLLPGGLQARYYMQRFERDSALEAIKKPVMEIRPFESGIAEALVENLARIKIKSPEGTTSEQAGQYVEPVQLQVVCYSIWEKLEGGQFITKDDLKKVGDVNQALENFYDERVGTVAKEKNVEERLIREWFNDELITSSGTRNMVLRNLKNDAILNDKVIQALQGDLVRAEMRAGQIWYELSHDRLIEPVRLSNAKWFSANLSIFQQQAALWAAQGRPEGMLLRGEELKQAEQEQAKRKAESKSIPKDEDDFLAACIRERDREKRDRRNYLLARTFAVVAIITSVIAGYLAYKSKIQEVAAVNDRNFAQAAVITATIAQGKAEEANKKLADAQGLLEADALAGNSINALAQSETISLGRLLAVEAYTINMNSDPTYIRPSVYQALFDSVGMGNELSLGIKPFSSASFSPNPELKWLVVNNDLWNLKNRQTTALALDSGEIIRSAFQSEDIMTLVTRDTSYYSDEPYKAHVVNATNQKDTPLSLFRPDFEIDDIYLSNNGRWIVVYGINYDGPDPAKPNSGLMVWDINQPNADPVSFDILEPGDIQSVAITDDGLLLVAATKNNLYIWRNDKDDLYEGTRTLKPDSQLIGSSFRNGSFSGKGRSGIQISPDGNLLAQLTNNKINVYDTKSTPEKKYTVADKVENISGFLFSPDNHSLIYVTSNYQTCSRGQSCQPSALVSQFPLEGINPNTNEIYNSTTADITAIDISSDGKLLIGDEAGYIRIWDISKEPIAKKPLQVTSAHTGKIINVLIGPDDQTVISASEDGNRLWKLTESGTDAIVINRILNTASNAIRSEDGNTLFVGGINTENDIGNIQVFSNLDDPNQQAPSSFDSDYGSNLSAIAISRDWMAAARTDNRYYYRDPVYYLDFWTRDPNAFGSPFVSFPVDSPVTSLVFYPDGKYLAVAFSTGEIWIAVTSELENIRQVFTPVPQDSSSDSEKKFPHFSGRVQLPNDLENIRSLFFTNDVRYLIGAGEDGVRIWDMQKYGAGAYKMVDASYPVRLNPNQKWLVAAGPESSIQQINLEDFSFSTIASSDQTQITNFAFDTDGNELAVAYKSGQVMIYQFPVTSNSPEPLTLSGAGGDINRLEFSPKQSGDRWLVASGGYWIYLWNLARPNEKPIFLWGYKGTVVYAGFANNGEWVVSAAQDQTLRFWSMKLENLRFTACKYAGRNLNFSEWNRYFSGKPYNLENANTCPDPDFRYQLEDVKKAEGTSTPAPVNTLVFFQPPTTTPTPLVTFVSYTIQTGDTLGLISNKLGVDINILIQDNNITNPNIVVPGQTLKIRIPNTLTSP